MICETCGGNRTEESCKLCEMFSSCAPPSISTEATMFAGMANRQHNKFNTKLGNIQGEALASELRAKGGSTTGKVYIGGLAEYPGDPRAWVSGKDDVKRVCRERNLNIVDGSMTHKADGRVDELNIPKLGRKKKSLKARVREAMKG